MAALAAGLFQQAHAFGDDALFQGVGEVVDRQRQLGERTQMVEVLNELTGDPAWCPTFAFRLGYPNTDVLPSARRPVGEVLI